MTTYKILGIVEEGECEHCGARCPRRRVAVDTPDGVERWGVVCAAKVTRRSSTTIVNAATAADFARRQAEHFATRDREARIHPASPAGVPAERAAVRGGSAANYLYNRTRRRLAGSYLAQNAAGDTVRVDGADPVDVAFYADRGFVAITSPVPAGLDPDNGGNTPILNCLQPVA